MTPLFTYLLYLSICYLPTYFCPSLPIFSIRLKSSSKFPSKVAETVFFRMSPVLVQASDIDSSVFTKCLLTNERIRNMRYAYSMGYYVALKKKGIPKRDTTGRKPEDTIRSDLSQSQKAAWFHMHEVLRAVKSTEAESRTELPRGWGVWGRGDDYLMGMKCKSGKTRKFWRRMWWVSYDTVRVLNVTELYT